MKRFFSLMAVCSLFALSVSGLAAAKPHRATLKLRQTSLGMILVNGRGRTLYDFAKDHRNKDACVKISGCLGVWPALTTGRKPLAGPGVNSSLLGTIKLAHGRKQVTYAGHPLYTYIGDSSGGQTSYVGISQFGGKWNALNAAGKEVK